MERRRFLYVSLAAVAGLATACTRDPEADRVFFQEDDLTPEPEPTATISPEPTATATPEPESTPPPGPTASPTPVKRVRVSPEPIVRGPANQPYLSLVINAGAGYEPAPAILDVLAARGVRTTFFLLGWFAERYPDLVRDMAAGGHEIASHGHSVFDLTAVSDAAVAADLERADTAISAITGRTTRPLWSPSAGYQDARVRGIAARLGYRPILWSQDSADWREDATADLVQRRSLAGAEPGAIIVLHFDSPTTTRTTARVLGPVIDAIRDSGMEPVTITDLVGEPL